MTDFLLVIILAVALSLLAREFYDAWDDLQDDLRLPWKVSGRVVGDAAAAPVDGMDDMIVIRPTALS